MALILYASALIRHTLAIILASLMSLSDRFIASLSPSWTSRSQVQFLKPKIEASHVH